MYSRKQFDADVAKLRVQITTVTKSGPCLVLFGFPKFHFGPEKMRYQIERLGGGGGGGVYS